jgi:hypothetical protein
MTAARTVIGFAVGAKRQKVASLVRAQYEPIGTDALLRSPDRGTRSGRHTADGVHDARISAAGIAAADRPAELLSKLAESGEVERRPVSGPPLTHGKVAGGNPAVDG